MHFGAVEGTGIEAIDPAFNRLFAGYIRVERLWSGTIWAEGPAWFPAGRYLVFSDVPNNRMLRYDEASGRVGPFRVPSNYSNGNTIDNDGRLVTCEHLTRRVTRTEADGSMTVLADLWEGKRFNSPNDVVVKSDGSIWFTDPSYGIDGDLEGAAAVAEIEGCHVYRIEPETGAVTQVITDMVRPNGLAFSPDEQFLYVADSGATHSADGPRHIRRFRVNGATLGGGEVFAECTAGIFDGFRVDSDHRLWTSAADGVHCLNDRGALIGKIRIPEIVANLTFGGPKRDRLFICGTSSLYAVRAFASGLGLG